MKGKKILRNVKAWFAGTGQHGDRNVDGVTGTYSTSGIRNRRPCPRCGLDKKYKHCCGR